MKVIVDKRLIIRPFFIYIALIAWLATVVGLFHWLLFGRVRFEASGACYLTQSL